MSHFRRLAAACLFPALRQEQYLSDSAYRAMIQQLADDGAGGFCIFQGELQETAEIIASLQQGTGGRLLFCADFEHGLPMRLVGGTAFPHAMAFGKADNPERTYAAAQIIAREMRALGVGWNFAPVCDINSNPSNPIINIRSFGETPEIVSIHAEAYLRGLQDEGIIACAKHFPGHGDTATDSHLSMPTLLHDRARLEHIELVPFRAAISAGVRSVMVAHLSVPALNTDGVPASLSDDVMRGILRKELGFEGLIVTDALEMRAITSLYNSGAAAVAAVKAGVDVVLIPENPKEALDALAAEAERDEDFAGILRLAAERIEKQRLWAQSFPAPPAPLPAAAHAQVALDIAKAAVTVADSKRILPISRYSSFAALAFCPDDMDSGTEFFRYLAQVVENDCDFGYVDGTLSDDEADALAGELSHAEMIIIGFFVRARAYKGNVAIGEQLMPKLRRIIAGRPFAAVLFGSPYLAETIGADCTVFCYSDVPASAAAAALALAGKKTKP